VDSGSSRGRGAESAGQTPSSTPRPAGRSRCVLPNRATSFKCAWRTAVRASRPPIFPTFSTVFYRVDKVRSRGSRGQNGLGSGRRAGAFHRPGPGGAQRRADLGRAGARGGTSLRWRFRWVAAQTGCREPWMISEILRNGNMERLGYNTVETLTIDREEYPCCRLSFPTSC